MQRYDQKIKLHQDRLVLAVCSERSCSMALHSCRAYPGHVRYGSDRYRNDVPLKRRKGPELDLALAQSLEDDSATHFPLGLDALGAAACAASHDCHSGVSGNGGFVLACLYLSQFFQTGVS